MSDATLEGFYSKIRINFVPDEGAKGSEGHLFLQTAGTLVVENVSVDDAYLSVAKKDAIVGVKYLRQQTHKKATPSNKAKIKSAPKNRFQLVFETDEAATLFVAKSSALGVRTRIVANAIPDTQSLAESVQEVQSTMDAAQVLPVRTTTYESLSHQQLLPRVQQLETTVHNSSSTNNSSNSKNSKNNSNNNSKNSNSNYNYNYNNYNNSNNSFKNSKNSSSSNSKNSKNKQQQEQQQQQQQEQQQQLQQQQLRLQQQQAVRVRLSDIQYHTLQNRYAQSRHLSTEEVQVLPGEIGLSVHKIKIWFQNKRAYNKSKSL
ncbi:hypothetical protein BJ741DRAFT_649421 [Chytriomyces cf. hyalinus JEL632]|nr:hypothetical protein BJ741DRAFT_649421 [Chytriomyces cf. hyalinus JEL632]